MIYKIKTAHAMTFTYRAGSQQKKLRVKDLTYWYIRNSFPFVFTARLKRVHINGQPVVAFTHYHTLI